MKKKPIMRKVTSIVLALTLILTSGVFAFAESMPMSENNAVATVENEAISTEVSEQAAFMAKPNRLRTQAPTNINPNAYDAGFEDNDWINTPYEWGNFSVNSSGFAVLDDTNKTEVNQVTRGIDIDFYRFTVYPNQGLKGRVGIRITNPIDNNGQPCANYDMYLYRENSVLSYTEIDNTLNTGFLPRKTVVTPEITVATTYIVGVVNRNYAPSLFPNNTYCMTMVHPWVSTHQQFAFSPSSLTSSGGGNISAVASVNLTNNATIPADALLKSVTVTSTRNTSLGNSYIQIGNYTHGIWQETIYSNIASWNFYNDNFAIPVKADWWLRYYSLALSSSTVSNPVLDIWYYFNQYANE